MSETHKLKREMTSFGGLVITLSCLSPSIGVFLAGSDVIHQSGSWAIAACLLAVLVGVVMSGVYAELGSAIPHAGGDYTVIGRTVGATAGFATLSSMLLGLPIGLALSALGVADYLGAIWPHLPKLSVAMSCVVIVTVLGALSVRVNALITGLFLTVEIAALVATAAIGFLHPHRDLVQVAIHPMMAAAHGGLQAPSLAVMGVATVGAIYAFNGYGSAIMFGEEIIGARHKVRGVVYAALGLAALTILPPMAAVIIGAADLSRLAASETPVADFIRAAGGPQLSMAISLGVAIAIFNAMIAIALVSGRVLYAASRDNAWPAPISRALSVVHPRYGSPWAATLVMGVAGTVLCVVPLSVLIMINGNGAAAGYGLLALGVILGRRSGATAQSHAAMPWHPVGPVLVLVAVAGMICAGLFSTGSGRIGLVVTAVVMSAGALYYHLVLRDRGAWAHHDPEEELDLVGVASAKA